MKRSISNAEKRQAGRRACVRVCVLYRLGGLLLGCALETQSGTVTNNLRRRFYWPSLGWLGWRTMWAHSNRLRVAELEDDGSGREGQREFGGVFIPMSCAQFALLFMGNPSCALS